MSTLPNLWNDQHAASLSEPELLCYSSNLLGSDKRITNYGGGNTNAKVLETDPRLAERTLELSEFIVPTRWLKPCTLVQDFSCYSI
jgi:hypothetical protein